MRNVAKAGCALLIVVAVLAMCAIACDSGVEFDARATNVASQETMIALDATAIYETVVATEER